MLLPLPLLCGVGEEEVDLALAVASASFSLALSLPLSDGELSSLDELDVVDVLSVSESEDELSSLDELGPDNELDVVDELGILAFFALGGPPDSESEKESLEASEPEELDLDDSTLRFSLFAVFGFGTLLFL